MARSAPILAIDTSTNHAGVGLLGVGVSIALSWDAGRNQTVSTLDQVDRCLSLGGLRPADLGGIAVATGPGMFTSLRVGVSLAKGLAFGLDLPVVGIPTLHITAGPWAGLERDVVAVVSVGRDRVVWQRFLTDGSEPLPPYNSTAGELRDALSLGGACLVAGEVPDDLAETLTERGTPVRAGIAGRRDPLLLAQLGRERFDRRGADDLTLLQPNYVHSRAGAEVGA